MNGADAAMFETWETQMRIDEAKRLTARVVDHLQYLLDIHENNAVVLYSDTLSKQIPKSYAANAFNVFREAMHQIELVRICALWDAPVRGRESIPTAIELIDDEKVLNALADQARAGHHEEFGQQQAETARASLKAAIKGGAGYAEVGRTKVDPQSPRQTRSSLPVGDHGGEKRSRHTYEAWGRRSRHRGLDIHRRSSEFVGEPGRLVI
jgi:AbiU2